MLKPAELAQQVEQLNEEQWYDFLDMLDEISRRRRQRASPDDRPATSGRDDVAAWVAKQHLIVDSAVREVWYLPTGAPPGEIRFLEVSDRLAASEATVDPIDFGLDVEGAPFRLFVADISSPVSDALKHGTVQLPSGWSLEGCHVWRRGRE